MWKPAIIIILLFCSHTLFAQSWKVYPYNPEGSLISFPDDEGRHPDEPVEWWYTTGHLTGESTGKRYSYMLSYFYRPVSVFDGFRIFNISDDESGLFFTDTQAVTYSTLSTDSLNIIADTYSSGTEYWRNNTDENGYAQAFNYLISAESANASVSLEYDAFKRPLILADSGLLEQGPDAYTYYYSLTGNNVTGTINFEGITESVSGYAWIDRQYGTVNPAEGLEYEWFSVQLTNGMDINMYNIFTPDNELPQTLTYRLMSVYVDDDNQYTTSSFEIDRLGYTYTADSLKSYSQKWRLTCGANNIDLLVSTIHPHYEVQLPFRFYEGPTHITGSVDGIPVQGKGFTELLHSYEKPDISIKPTANLWEESTALNWSLNNPDDGNQVKYDLAYSTDGTYFQVIAYGLEDTVYYWDSSYLPAGTDVWLKVKAYSVDKTLVDSTVVRLVSTTGIEDTGRDKRVRVYPNPNTGYFTLAGEGMRKIEIFDCHGRMVFDSVINDPVYHIDISSEPRGVYLIKIFLPENVISRKIIRL